MHKKPRKPKPLLLAKEIVKLLSVTAIADVRGGQTVPFTHPPEQCF